MTHVNGLIALAAGLLSFFSPCVLPLLPSTLIFLSGISIDENTDLHCKQSRRAILLHSFFFVLGFSAVFIALGLSSSALGIFLSDYNKYLLKIGGAILIVLGLFFLNLIPLPFLHKEKKICMEKRPVGIFGAFIVGATFSLGWTPCVGPTLSSILIIASTEEYVWRGGYLLAMYSLGLALPFIVSAILFRHVLDLLKRYGHVVQYTVKIMGILLIITGLALMTGSFTKLARLLQMLFVWQ